MASSRLLSCLLLAAVALVLLKAELTFLSGPAPQQRLRGNDAAAAVAVAGVAAASVPLSAHAFVYKGKEYFDVLFGIDPLWWGVLIFATLYCGAVLKNALRKYYKPFDKDAKPAKVGGFVGKEKEVLKYGPPGAGNPETNDDSKPPPALQQSQKIWF